MKMKKKNQYGDCSLIQYQIMQAHIILKKLYERQ